MQKNGLIIFGLLCVAWLAVTSWAFAGTPASAVNDQCLSCHSNPNFSVERGGQKVSLFVDKSAFDASVHGTNSCTSCHQNEKEFPHIKTGTTAKDSCNLCHTDATNKFLTSDHGKSNQVSCNSCHGPVHGIKSSTDTIAPTNRQNIADTCSSCHQGRVANSYAASFHGRAVYLGSEKTATCVSCHGSHDIFGPDNPASTVAKANIPETCASCHIKAQPNFANGIEHFELKPDGPGAPMYYTFKFFTWLTIITITLLIIHIELELFRRYKEIGRGSSH